jgi:DNA-binding NtrC family response regulator
MIVNGGVPELVLVSGYSGIGKSQMIQYRQRDAVVREILQADIVFAGGEPAFYTSLLRRVREARPTMPFIVVAGIPETIEWLDALGAGATDYCSPPIDARQLYWLMECALPHALAIRGDTTMALEPWISTHWQGEATVVPAAHA